MLQRPQLLLLLTSAIVAAAVAQPGYDEVPGAYVDKSYYATHYAVTAGPGSTRTTTPGSSFALTQTTTPPVTFTTTPIITMTTTPAQTKTTSPWPAFTLDFTADNTSTVSPAPGKADSWRTASSMVADKLLAQPTADSGAAVSAVVPVYKRAADLGPGMSRLYESEVNESKHPMPSRSWRISSSWASIVMVSLAAIGFSVHRYRKRTLNDPPLTEAEREQDEMDSQPLLCCEEV